MSLILIAKTKFTIFPQICTDITKGCMLNSSTHHCKGLQTLAYQIFIYGISYSIIFSLVKNSFASFCDTVTMKKGLQNTRKAQTLLLRMFYFYLTKIFPLLF